MKNPIKKLLAGAIITFMLVSSSFAIMPSEVYADIENNRLQAGVTAAFSYQLMKSVATVMANKPSLSLMSNDMGIAEELISYNKDGNITICGYVNLGIVQVEGNLNVREEPSKDGKIVGKITNNCGCEVFEVENGWARIESGNCKGYISSEYLLYGDDALAVVNDIARHVVTVTTDCLRVRSKASTDSSIMTTVSKGEQLEIVDVLDGWVKVAVDDDEGYVAADYCTISYELKKGMTLSELYFGSGVSDLRVRLVQFALKYVGNRYVWGGTSLTKGIDCSGFTMRVFEQFGYSLPHYSGDQARMGTKIKASEAKPGDLFFYGHGGVIGHVAIYIGNGQIVHASNKRDGIKISNCSYRTVIKVVRILP